MKRVLWLIAVVLCVAGIVGCRGSRNRPDPTPEGGRWERLGVRTVNFRGDRDTILAGIQGTFRAIRIEVDRSELEMYDVRVNFHNGEHWSPNTRHYFREGSWSHVIDLPGGDRRIRSIDFAYRTAHRGEGRAVVEVWGLN